MIMWGAILRRRQVSLQQKLQQRLEQELLMFARQNDEKVAIYTRQDESILAVQNEAIVQTQKVNMEYKYQQATSKMKHDGSVLQVSAMIGALKGMGVLS